VKHLAPHLLHIFRACLVYGIFQRPGGRPEWHSFLSPGRQAILRLRHIVQLV
jgi:hypothetical protein